MAKVRKLTNKTSDQQSTPTSVPLIIDVPLSPQWAFVVQFRATPGGQVYEAGRIEHLVSGRTGHFQSLEELTTYLTAELQVAGNMAKQ